MVRILKATRDDVSKALIATAMKFDTNVTANKFETRPNGTTHVVTLKVRDSHGSGAGIGFSGRATAHACWHAFGVFFDEVFKEAPNLNGEPEP